MLLILPFQLFLLAFDFQIGHKIISMKTKLTKLTKTIILMLAFGNLLATCISFVFFELYMISEDFGLNISSEMTRKFTLLH